MTAVVTGNDLARRLQAVPQAVVESSQTAVFVRPQKLLDVARFLKEQQDFDFVSHITAIDYLDHFEVVYHLNSFKKNESAVIKVRLPGREKLSVPSLTGLYQGADLQESEVYDLMGIAFEGHPNLRRILLWQGFPGHPLRKDFI